MTAEKEQFSECLLITGLGVTVASIVGLLDGLSIARVLLLGVGVLSMGLGAWIASVRMRREL